MVHGSKIPRFRVDDGTKPLIQGLRQVSATAGDPPCGSRSCNRPTFASVDLQLQPNQCSGCDFHWHL